jgi:hypothetical protein
MTCPIATARFRFEKLKSHCGIASGDAVLLCDLFDDAAAFRDLGARLGIKQCVEQTRSTHHDRMIFSYARISFVSPRQRPARTTDLGIPTLLGISTSTIWSIAAAHLA